MANPMSGFIKRLKFWLFEEKDYVYAENPKHRRHLHNAHLIQAWAAFTGVIVMAIIPLVVWLITLQDFVIGYLIFSMIACFLYLTISLYIKHLNKQYELN